MASLHFSSSTCGLGVESPFSSSFLPFLESSILSWKAARLLFRHHLHINAARRLAGRHLMRRWQHLKIFVPVYSYLLFDTFHFHFAVGFVRGVTLKWLISSPDTLDRSPEVTIVLGHGQIPTSILHLSSEGNFIPSFVGCPRIFVCPQTGYWAWPILTPFVCMGLDIGLGLLQYSLNAGRNWLPQWQLKKLFICKSHDFLNELYDFFK